MENNMIKLTSTNVVLVVQKNITDNVITIYKDNVEELRDLLNDYLQMERENKL